MKVFSLLCILLLLCGSVQAVTATETYLSSRLWGTPGFGINQFNSPEGIAVDGTGNVYVADMNNDRISFFTKASLPQMPSSIGRIGSGHGQFFYPHGVAVDSTGNVYVADTGNHQIQKFTVNGNFNTQWGIKGSGTNQFNSPEGIAVDGAGNVYVADTGNNRIEKFTSSGDIVTSWGSYGSEVGQFNRPTSVAVDNTGIGYIYVADTGNNRIQKFTLTGDLVATRSISNSGASQFNRPTSVAVDTGGSVYVADTGNNRIQKFTSSGDLITSWGSYGSESGQFVSPCGITVDGEGTVYVADTGNNRIQRFTPVQTYATLDFVPGTKTLVLGEHQSFDLTLSGIDTGLSGSEVIVSVANPSVLDIVGASPPVWSSTPQYYDLPSSAVTIGGADLGNRVQGRMSNIPLGNLTVQGKLPGTTSLDVTRYQLDDDSGNLVPVITMSVVITVSGTLIRSLPSSDTPPHDLDQDGLYEDVNGDGVFNFNDVIQYFNQIDWISDNEPTVAFDFNRNGRVDFGDIVTLFNIL
ncbi:dockerin type I domain-containing protein [Methanosphaerula palustris]|uniref:NHL repeat containing protein n=1 Tax=Methanosphaerula palustris (strain ATCC BAA-1556 / DSM 19958 / E1-9c) TaxID=521011 RepID=B8GDM1_METPE|nr:dockerin type I domain-containing protein [Methanosphaerula palustris]ACL17372.1 NHL repeat containing protein [Methanosphaerula palustris E1-9c]